MSTIALPERLTIGEARATLDKLQAALKGADGAAVLDASALKELDTSAVAVLLECQRLAHARGAALKLQAAPTKLVELAKLYGVGELIGL